MVKKNEIPRHSLRNRQGERVSFDMQQWGTGEGYNFEKAHRHNFHEILVFEKGGAQHDIDFQTYKAGARSIHFVAADNVHLLARTTGSRGYSLLFVNDYIDSSLLDNLPFARNNPTIIPDKTCFKEFNESMLKIGKELKNKGVFHEQIVKGLLMSALYQLARMVPAEREARVSAVSRHMAAFKALIGQHHTEHKTVEYYADELHISPKHLIDICNKQTGKTPLKHIQDHTISEAKRMLYHTQLSVKEVAYELGFAEPSYFSKHFRAVTGYTPVAYRKSK